MDEIFLHLIPLALAIYSILLVIRSWKHPRTRWLRLAAIVCGAPLGVLAFGWPEGVITGLAASVIGPLIVQRWENRLPLSVEPQEKVEDVPPQITSKEKENA